MEGRRRAAVLVGVVAIAATLSGCASTARVTALLSPRAPKCAVSAPSGPIPLRITHHHGTAVYTSVCVNGQGPYPFVLSTGAGASLIASSLAAKLGLPSAQRPGEHVGIGCVATTHQVEVRRWSVGGVRLAGQDVLVDQISGLGGTGQPQGILGGDVLSRFGAIGINFNADQATVLHPEGKVPTAGTVIRGAPSSPPPSLVQGESHQDVLLTVARFGGAALVTAYAVFGRQGPFPFLVDSGARTSAISPSTATVLQLRGKKKRGVASAIGCPTGSTVTSGPWSMANAGDLKPRSMSTVAFAGGTLSGVGGALGADFLSSYGSIVLDYQSAVLWLGAT